MNSRLRPKKQIRFNGDVFLLSSQHNRKHDAVKGANKLRLKGFNVRIVESNPFFIYKGEKHKGVK